MPLTSKQKWLLAGGVTALALGCIWAASQLKKTYNAIYTLAGIIVKNISLSDINFTLLLKIENKGGISVDVTKQSYDVFVNNMFVMHVDYPSNDQLAACKALPISADRGACKDKYITRIHHNASDTVPINVQFNPSDKLKEGLQNLSVIVSNQKSVLITVKGKLTFSAGLVKMTDFPFEETLTLEDIVKNSLQVKS